MRRFIVAACCAFVLAVAAAGVRSDATDATDSLAWMAGYWTITNDPRRSYEEIWLAPRGGTMVGVSRDTHRGGVSFEYLRIETRDDGVYYVAKPSNQTEAAFRLVETGPAQRAVFEDPAHDFPQRIAYTREGDVLTATISGILNGEERSSSWAMTLTPFVKETQ